jgi:hypothetical protein
VGTYRSAVDCEASPAAGLDTVHHLSSGNKLFPGTTAATLRADLIFNMDRSDTSLIIERIVRAILNTPPHPVSKSTRRDKVVTSATLHIYRGHALRYTGSETDD